MNHRLKVLPEFFTALADGRKTFEVRRDDRGYAVRDVLVLQEWAQGAGYTGQSLSRRVTYLLRGAQAEDVGVRPGFVVLGLEPTT